MPFRVFPWPGPRPFVALPLIRRPIRLGSYPRGEYGWKANRVGRFRGIASIRRPIRLGSYPANPPLPRALLRRMRSMSSVVEYPFR